MIFVTGGTGLLGRHLLQELEARGEKVIALYRKEIPAWSKNNHIEWIQGDIHDVVLLLEIMQRVEYVYHCAGMVSFNPQKKYELLKVNAEGTANVVNMAIEAGVKKLVHVSSVAAIGRKRDGAEPINENTQWTEETNNSHYGRSKYFAELEVWRGISEGLDAVIVNPSIILGKGNWEEGSSAMFQKAWQSFKWYTEGATGFVDADDVANAMINLMHSDITGERFILSAENWKFKDLFTAMATTFNKQPPYKLAKPWMGSLLWRLEKTRSLFTGKDPLITKETLDAAQRMVQFDNTKLLTMVPQFQYTPMAQTIAHYCNYYAKKYLNTP